MHSQWIWMILLFILLFLQFYGGSLTLRKENPGHAMGKR